MEDKQESTCNTKIKNMRKNVAESYEKAKEDDISYFNKPQEITVSNNKTQEGSESYAPFVA